MTETTRRNVVRGAAWTVPVIAVAAAAPAFAASGSCKSILGRWHDYKNQPAYYKVKLNCEGTVSQVFIDGREAFEYPYQPYTDWWYITRDNTGRDRDYRVKVIFTNGGVVEQTVRFTPWNNGL